MLLGSVTVGQLVQLACIWEATARKPGNVHPGRDFHDVAYINFLASAAAIGPILDRAALQPLGQTILQAIEATAAVAATNTNLGMVLLLAPLAAVPDELARRASEGGGLTPSLARRANLQADIERVLAATTVADAELVYRAIRLARPGGMGPVDEQDVHSAPTQTLRDVMALAADRDLIARQYANGFREVFEDGATALHAALARTGHLEDAIIVTHLELMARHPDTLIARKRGKQEAEEASRRARAVLDLDWPATPTARQALIDLDAWLCDAAHARNPGTSADLVAASLFVCLQDGIITVPPQFPWARGNQP